MKKKYNIAIDARFLLRQQRGMPLYAFMLCKHIPQILSEHQFFLFINEGFEHNDKIENYQKRLAIFQHYNNVTLINANAEDEISWEQKTLPKLIEKHDIDLLHMPGNRVCLNTKVKQIVTFHDAMEWTHLSFFSSYEINKGIRNLIYSLKMKCYRGLTYFLGMKKVDKILTISQYSKDALCDEFPAIKNKTVFAHHGIPEGFSNPSNINPIEHRQGILMLGGDSFQKNPENTLRAWALLPDTLKANFPLTIAGFTGGETSPLMQTLIELGIRDKVTILGWITSQQLIELFQSTYLFLFASRIEGFGFPLLQAMSCGTPTLCSKADVLLEIGTNAIVSAEAESPELLKEQLLKVLSSQALWQELHENSLVRAKDFEWEKTCKFIAQTYLNLLGENKSL